MSFKGRSNKFVKINNIPGSTTTLEVPNVGAGVYTVKIRAVNSRGAKSTWKEVTQRIISVPPSLNRVGRVARGGDLSSSPSIDASTAQAALEKVTLLVDEAATKKEKIEATIELRKAKARLQAVA